MAAAPHQVSPDTDWSSTIRWNNRLQQQFRLDRCSRADNGNYRSNDNDMEVQAAAVLASLQHQPLRHQQSSLPPSPNILVPSLPSTPIWTATTPTEPSTTVTTPWMLEARHDPPTHHHHHQQQQRQEQQQQNADLSSPSMVSWESHTAQINPTTMDITMCDSFMSSSSSHGSDERHHAYPHRHHPLQTTKSMETRQTEAAATATIAIPTTSTTTTTTWYSGCVSLAMDEDDDILSPLHCFMRKYCVEAFTATPDDITTPRYGKAHGGRIVVGQVGIRCLHCKHHPPSSKAERSVCYPSSLRNIYHSIETWQRRHSWVCQDIPKWIRQQMLQLMTCSRSGAGGRRQYWEDSARKIGMVNTDHGVRFCRPPGVAFDITTTTTTTTREGMAYTTTAQGSDDDDDDKDEQRDATSVISSVRASLSLSSSSPRSLRNVSLGSNSSSGGNNKANMTKSIPIVLPQDKRLVTDYLFLLMDQMEVCYFTEEDRIGGRSKVKTCPIGFPGMQCKHCLGKAGFGRYFPATLQALALANSDRNIHNHLIKCRKCPLAIQEQLQQTWSHASTAAATTAAAATTSSSTRIHKYKCSSSSNNTNNIHGKSQVVILKNKRGSRKTFFEQIWNRMHHYQHGTDKTMDNSRTDDDGNNDSQTREK